MFSNPFWDKYINSSLLNTHITHLLLHGPLKEVVQLWMIKVFALRNHNIVASRTEAIKANQCMESGRISYSGNHSYQLHQYHVIVM